MHQKAYSLLDHVKRNLRSGNLQYVDQSQRLRTCGSRQLLGHQVYVNLKFLRPVKNGDTITVTGKVSSQRQVEQGAEIVVELLCQNQDQDRTAAGIGTAIV